MSKQFSVTVTAFATVIVTADTEDEAYEYASDSVSFGDLKTDESEAKEIDHEHLSGALRHADNVSYDLEEAQRFAKANPFKKVPKRLLKKGD